MSSSRPPTRALLPHLAFHRRAGAGSEELDGGAQGPVLGVRLGHQLGRACCPGTHRLFVSPRPLLKLHGGGRPHTGSTPSQAAHGRRGASGEEPSHGGRTISGPLPGRLCSAMDIWRCAERVCCCVDTRGARLTAPTRPTLLGPTAARRRTACLRTPWRSTTLWVTSAGPRCGADLSRRPPVCGARVSGLAALRGSRLTFTLPDLGAVCCARQIASLLPYKTVEAVRRRYTLLEVCAACAVPARKSTPWLSR